MPTSGLSETITDGVRVRVRPFYLPDESVPHRRQFVFGYRVEIRNDSVASVVLERRRWLIIDAEGELEEIEGPGVVGCTPHLAPGESFRYTSYCPLSTPWGTMEGSYRMRLETGEVFDARIQRFYLVGQPAALTAAHPAR